MLKTKMTNPYPCRVIGKRNRKRKSPRVTVGFINRIFVVFESRFTMLSTETL